MHYMVCVFHLNKAIQIKNRFLNTLNIIPFLLKIIHTHSKKEGGLFLEHYEGNWTWAFYVAFGTLKFWNEHGLF